MYVFIYLVRVVVISAVMSFLFTYVFHVLVVGFVCLTFFL